MKVSGFTIVRNAVKFDYPVVEAIRSVLPMVDEFVVAVGNSDDGTRDLIESIGDPKIRIIDTVWNDALREGGKVLADETNKAFDAVSADADWAFYIQGDEVIHEKYHAEIRNSMERFLEQKEVEALVFSYLHFYGSYDFVGDSRKWYRREARIIRNNKNIRSYRDAQGFRMNGVEKLKAKKIDACVYHYGWVKHPKFQQQKQESFHKMWHDDAWMKANVKAVDEFDYSGIDALRKFDESHPEVMKVRIEKMNWSFSFDPVKARKKTSFKNRMLYALEKLSGWRPGEFRNYRLI